MDLSEFSDFVYGRDLILLQKYSGELLELQDKLEKLGKIPKGAVYIKKSEKSYLTKDNIKHTYSNYNQELYLKGQRFHVSKSTKATTEEALVRKYGKNYNSQDYSIKENILIAKNKIAASKLSDAMTKGEIQKEYIAICHKIPKDRKGTIDAPIQRKEGSAITREVNPNGKPSLTQYEVISEDNNLSLVKLNPVTGRTHQLRVHLSHIGHPIYGDDMYGSPIEGERCRLHCRALKITHPITGEKQILKADIPKDFDIIKTRL